MKCANQKQGFTIVELLTVMAVIALLIGLLVPALSMVKDRAKDIQQRAQFHAISSGLEMFKADFGSYPESNDNSYPPQNPFDNRVYTGANKLAEAMIGLDLLGFHPKSGFTATGVNDIDGDGRTEVIYNPTSGFVSSTGTYAETAQQNIQNRKMFVELENANAFQMQDIYRNYGNFVPTNYVLCDVYSKKRYSGKKTGMPILYYRARTNYQFQDSTDVNRIADDIYYYYDNYNILDLGLAEDQTNLRHRVHDTLDENKWLYFEDLIVNKQVQNSTRTAAFPQGIKRPYKAESFILWSAGKDGNFGTGDDVFNFTKEAE